MQRVVSAVLFTVFFVSGFVPAGILSPYNQSVEVQITHSHDDGSHAHTHDYAPLAKSKSSHEGSTSQHSDDESQSHTHTLVVAAAPSVIMPQNISFVLKTMTDKLARQTQDQNFPLDRSLGSIFRPPILG